MTFSASQVSPFSFATFGEMNWKFWSRSTKTGYGDVVWTRTLCVSTTSTALIASWLPFCWLFCSGLITRSQFHLTTSALNGSPLWNLTSLRSSTSQVVGELGVQEVARWGTIRFVFGSRTPRLSLAWYCQMIPLRWLCMGGSSVGRSTLNATLMMSLPDALAAGAGADGFPYGSACAAGA